VACFPPPLRDVDHPFFDRSLDCSPRYAQSTDDRLWVPTASQRVGPPEGAFDPGRLPQSLRRQRLPFSCELPVSAGVPPAVALRRRLPRRRPRGVENLRCPGGGGEGLGSAPAGGRRRGLSSRGAHVPTWLPAQVGRRVRRWEMLRMRQADS